MITSLRDFFNTVDITMAEQFAAENGAVHFEPLRQTALGSELDIVITPGSFTYEDDIGTGYRGRWDFTITLHISALRGNIYHLGYTYPLRAVNALYQVDYGEAGVNNLQVETISPLQIDDGGDRPRGQTTVTMTVYTRHGEGQIQ